MKRLRVTFRLGFHLILMCGLGVSTAYLVSCSGNGSSSEGAHDHDGHHHHHDDGGHSHGDTSHHDDKGHQHGDTDHHGEKGHHGDGEHGDAGHHHEAPHDGMHHDDKGHTEAKGHTFAFVDDKKNNKWVIQVFEPEKGLVKTIEVPELAERTAKKAKDSSTDDLGPGWGDVVLSHSHKRIFANALNADALVVVDVEKMVVERIYEFGFGDRPVHNYLPNHGTEAWIHLDGKGSFYVVNTETLDVVRGLNNLVTCTSPEVGTGHGKLLYSKEMGDLYFCTNTSEPAMFAIDGKEKKVLKKFTVCGVAPEDDPNTPEDESKGPLKGGTHDKAYLPGPGLVVAQCTGGAGFAFIDPTKLEIVEDKVKMSGSLAYSPANEYVLSINAGATEKQVQVWDKSDTQDNKYAYDFTVDVDGSPSARGTQFRKEGDFWQAWIPQTAGSNVAVVNLKSKEVKLVAVGKVTKPEGAGHFSRQGTMGKHAFYTHSDDGLVKVDFTTLTMKKVAGSIQGTISRIIFADPGAHAHP